MFRFLYFFLILFGFFSKAVMAEDIRSPRFSPDDKKIIFDMRSDDFPEGSRIHIYDMENKTLGYYMPDEGQVWKQGYISHSGKHIVFAVIPRFRPNEDLFEQRYATFGQTQIAIMDVDGSDFRFLTSEDGYKGMPVFSPDDKQVAYAKSGRIRDRKGAKTVAADWDFYEVLTLGGESKLFAGPFKFFLASLSFYFKEDTMLLNGDSSRLERDRGGYKNYSNYFDAIGNGSAFMVKRGQKELGPSIIKGVAKESARDSSFSKEDIFYIDSNSSGKQRWVKIIYKNGKTESIEIPKNCFPSDGVVSPSGKLFVVSCGSRGHGFLKLLNLASRVWEDISLPEASFVINH
jgi:hypothetical protein